MSEIVTRRLECGVTLVVEPIPNVASAALRWLLPVGSATDSDAEDGQAAMLGELVFRGAGALSSREHSDALDRLGVQRTSHAMTHHLRIDATLLGQRVTDALPLLTMMVREPSLADDAIDPVRSLCLQSLESLDDDPQHLAMIRLREQHLPPPFNRHGYGRRETLQAMTGERVRAAWRDRAVPEGTIMTAAGAVDPELLGDALDGQFAGWSGNRAEPAPTGPAARGYLLVEQETAQVHIALAWDAPPEADEHSMLERLAMSVLSGSTSGRLFTEVRQKRSLCYSVGASYHADRDRGMVVLYAGTTPERAQETLDVCMVEIDRLFGPGGVTEDEFARAVTGFKSRVVMQGESTSARATALGQDHYRLGRARSLDELAAAIDAVTLDQLNAYVAARSVGPFTTVSIGPGPLNAPSVEPAPAGTAE